MDAIEYKKYLESFMENNHGTTFPHTFFCIFFTVQCSIYTSIADIKSKPFQYFYEYIIIVLPIVVAHTVLSNYIYMLNVLIFVFLMRKIVDHYPKLLVINSFTLSNNFNTKHVLSISIIRALTYLITVCCILAVDFQAFPRYLAKTESFGYSLMDTGVGLFSLMSGLVHKDIRKHKWSSILKSNAKFLSVLVVLGVARYVSVKQLDYQEHVSEYGVHWNFFFTLAVCKLLSTFILYFSKHALLFSLFTIVLHEFILYKGLQIWVFNDNPRNNLVDANREGITSSPGYVALYLFAVYVKEMLLDTSVKRYLIILKLILSSVFLCIAAYFVNIYLPTSRTLANAGYYLYLTATLMTVLAIMYPIEVLFQEKSQKLCFNVPLILRAVNENGLIFFLISNILTGAINLSMRTLFLSSFTTLLILNSYMMLAIGLVVFLKKNNVKL